MARFSGLMLALGALSAIGGAVLPWVVGPDRRGIATGPGEAILVGLALLCILTAFGLILGGSATGLAITALIAAVPAAGIVMLDYVNATDFIGSGETNVLGPGPYVAAIGIALWTISAISVFFVTTPVTQTKVRSSEAGSTR